MQANRGLAPHANTGENATTAVTHTQGYLIQPNNQIVQNKAQIHPNIDQPVQGARIGADRSSNVDGRGSVASKFPHEISSQEAGQLDKVSQSVNVEKMRPGGEMPAN